MARIIQVFSIVQYCLILFSFVSSFENHESEVTGEILQLLQIRHCMLIVESPNEVKLNRRVFHNLFTAQVTAEQLKWFFNYRDFDHFRVGIVLKINAVDILRDLFEKDPVKVSKFTWMLFTNKDFGHEINVPYNCKFLIVQTGKGSEFLIKEIYYVKFSGPFVVDFGNWSKASGLAVESEFSRRRKDMNGVALIRADRDANAFCDRFTFEAKHREMWEEYSLLLNFSLIAVNDMLYNKSTDAMAPDGTSCALGHHSLNYFPDTVNPTCLADLFIAIKFDNDIGQGWKSYFKPFTKELWGSIIIFLVVSTICFGIISYFYDMYFHVNIFIPFYSFCSQGGDEINTRKITNFSVWISFLMPYISSVVIVSAYSGIILAKVMVQLPKIPFTDLETFYKDGTYKLGAMNNTFQQKYFMRSEDPFISKIYHQMFINEKEYPNKYEEAADRMCEDRKFAFLPPVFDELELRSKCRIFKIPRPMMRGQCGFRMKPNSSFKYIFNKILNRFYFTGMMRRENLTKPIEYKINYSEEFVSITVSQVIAALGLVPIGIILGLIVFAIEVFVKRRKNNLVVYLN